MSAPKITHILFDFFGTLVSYSPNCTKQGFARSHDITRTLGATLTYREFLARWATASEQISRLSDIDDREYSMADIGTAFLRDVLGRTPAYTEVDLLVQTYLSEWNKGVRYPAGITDLLAELATRYRLAVVSNTQEADLVPDHLKAMGAHHLFDAVVTSFEVGWRKPHSKIYAVALDQLRIDPACAVFVGDTYNADYQGPSQAGIRSFLIDPHRRAAIPDAARLSSIFELPARLAKPTERDSNLAS